MRIGHCCVARYYGTVVIKIAVRSCAGNWISVVHYGTVLGALRFFLLAVHARETGAVLCQTALWNCLRNAIASF